MPVWLQAVLAVAVVVNPIVAYVLNAALKAQLSDFRETLRAEIENRYVPELADKERRSALEIRFVRIEKDIERVQDDVSTVKDDFVDIRAKMEAIRGEI